MPLPSSALGGRVPLPVRGTMPALDPQLKLNQPNITSEGAVTAILLTQIIKQSWAAPAAGSATAFISTPLTGATNMPNNNTKTQARGALWDGTFGSTGKPDFDRNVVVTVTHGSSIVAVNGVISGIDNWGNTCSETWSVTAGGTSKTYTTATSFSRVDSITIIAVSDATANSLTLGTGVVFGLFFPLPVPSAVAELMDTSVPTAGTFVAKSVAVNTDKNGTYSPNTAPNGTHNYTVWCLSDDPTAIGTGGP